MGEIFNKDYDHMRIRGFEALELCTGKDMKGNVLVYKPGMDSAETRGFDHVLSPSMERLRLEELLSQKKDLRKKYLEIKDGEIRDITTGKVRKLRVGYLKALITVSMESILNNKAFWQIKSFLKKNLRTLYEEGVIIHGTHYVEYKRTASQAKEGNHYFIAKELYDEMKNWSWMGLDAHGREGNMTEAAAYESLTLSSIIGTVRIDPQSILLVDDLKYSFDPIDVGDSVCMIVESTETEERKGKRAREGKGASAENPRKKLKVVRAEDKGNENWTVENDVFDGEGLLDTSLFSEEFEGRGMLLLRNHFFKCCAFHTKIQDFYREYFGEEGYEKAEVYDMFGRPMKAKDVRLITTPNSLKFLKFSYFLEAEGRDEREVAYDYWRQHAEEVFGVVKYEHASVYGGKQRLSYQMINSLPLTEENVEKLITEEVDYVNALKNDDDVFLQSVRENGVKLTTDFVAYITGLNRGFLDTDLARKWRRERIKNYKYKLELGKIRISGDNYVMCSMPYEMLCWSAKPKEEKADEFKKRVTPILDREEIYIAGKDAGIEVSLFRNPHICASAVGRAVTKKSQELNRYFCFMNSEGTSNILVLSPARWDIMEKLGGADFDSDTVMCTDNSVIREAADIVAHTEKESYPVPHNCLETTKKKVTLTKEALLEVDRILFANAIGRTVNLSQALNSQYWYFYHQGKKKNKKKLLAIYNGILILDVLSTLEIDKAKHQFEIKTWDVLEQVKKESGYNTGTERKNSNIKYPLFMGTQAMKRKNRKSTKGRNRKPEDYNENAICPMDYVVQILESKTQIRRKSNEHKKEIKDLFEFPDNEDSVEASRRILFLGLLAGKLMEFKRIDSSREDMEWSDKEEQRWQICGELQAKFKKNKITEDEYRWLLHKILDSPDSQQKGMGWSRKNPKYAMEIIKGASPEVFSGVVEVIREGINTLRDCIRQKEYPEDLFKDKRLKKKLENEDTKSLLNACSLLDQFFESVLYEPGDPGKMGANDILLTDMMMEGIGEVKDDKMDSLCHAFNYIKRICDSTVTWKPGSNRRQIEIFFTTLSEWNESNAKDNPMKEAKDLASAYRKYPVSDIGPKIDIFKALRGLFFGVGDKIKTEKFTKGVPNRATVYEMISRVFKQRSELERYTIAIRKSKMRALALLWSIDNRKMGDLVKKEGR